MNALTTAISSGMPAKKILEYLIRKSPSLKSKITTALASGLSTDKIVQFFSKDKNLDKLKQSMENAYPMENNANPMVQAQNVRSQNLGNDMASGLQRTAGPVLASAGALGASFALRRAIPSILQSTGILNPQAPQAPNQSQKKSQIPQQPPILPGPQAPSPNPTPQQPPNVPQGTPVSPNIAQNPQVPQAQGISVNANQILTKHNIKDKVDQILQAGNGPQEVSAYVEKFDPKVKKLIEKEAGMPLEKVLEEYVKATPNEPQNVAPMEQPSEQLDAGQSGLGFKEAFGTLKGGGVTEKLYEGLFDSLKQGKNTFAGIKDPILAKAKEPFDKGLIKSPKDLKDFAEGKLKLEEPKMEANSTVATPHGIGEVKAIRNGEAIVEVDGKKHKVKESELEAEPEEIKSLNIEDAVKSYLDSIPEKEKSSVIDVSLFDPTTQELQVRFPNGDQWVYGPIPEEIFDKINSMTGIPITSGESKLRGTIWDKGTSDSAGADFFKMVKKLVKEGKIQERKLKTGIDLFKGFTRVKKRK